VQVYFGPFQKTVTDMDGIGAGVHVDAFATVVPEGHTKEAAAFDDPEIGFSGKCRDNLIGGYVVGSDLFEEFVLVELLGHLYSGESGGTVS
jgi:hypothetical protein